MRTRMILSGLLLIGLTTVAEASQADEGWLAWVGCWRAEGDSSGRSLCIVPEADGVRMITLNGSTVESESLVVANGIARTITQEGCTGSETARWSADRQRVFLHAVLDCGNNVTRNVTGIFAMLSTNEWASVQSIGTAGTTSMHTVRYVEVQPADLPASIEQAFRDNRLARETVRIAAASRLSLDDVVEAVKLTEASVVEGWLTTVAQQFDLNGQKLIALADAGVPGSVIDVLVAISNPGAFAVRAELASDRGGWGRRRPNNCYDDYYGYPYDPFGYRHRGGCYGGGFYGGGYYGPSVIVIDRGHSRSRGKVTKDGYKSGRPRDNAEPASVGTSAPAAKAPSSSGSDSGSSGGSEGGGRKAKPRDNN